MSASNHRIKSYQTYHHLMSRIAHKVYFLTEEVRNDFIEMIRRASDFCGIKLVAWCIMTNHFHLLVYLPEPEKLEANEILRRFGVLKGQKRLDELKKDLDAVRRANGDDAIRKRLDEISALMYDIGEFMKIVKQWMTQEYNARYAHRGTLWEAVYKDVGVKNNPTELAKRAGYIHLNPIRAAITDGFTGYVWSSFAALARGDLIALEGMRHIYGAAAEKREILDAHHELMSKLLEQIKIERARDIARKRLAGFNIPADSLTTEAMIAQEAAHLNLVMDEVVEHDIINKSRGRPSKMAELELKIRKLLEQNPDLKAEAIVEATGCSRSAVYRSIKAIKSLSQNSGKEV